ncbi:MAG: patatin-like phospholipase family protein [Bacteroidia bacterium]
MKILFRKHQGLRRIFYFFPLQLFLVTIKENLVFVFIWSLFFGFITKVIAGKYGVPYLFLYPEYFNRVSFSSYLLLGFSCGGFIMSFNVSSYIMNSFRFPFLATLERPFFIFILNNCLIPLAFLIAFVCCEFHGRTYDHIPASTVFYHTSAFLLGVTIFLFITMTYFYLFDKNIFKVFGIGPKKNPKVSFKKEKVRLGYGMEWETASNYATIYTDRTWYVETYIGGSLNVKLARGYEHYDYKMLKRIFKQNHQTGAVFEVVAIISLLLLGVFRDNQLLMVPAAASIFLLFTIYTMLVSAIHNWLRGWTTIGVIVILLAINYVSSTHWQWFAAKAYGLDYSTPPAQYSFGAFKKLNSDHNLQQYDKNHTIGILDLWKSKNSMASNDDKPPFIIINTSGGGIRSAMWTYYIFRYLDSAFNGNFFKRTELITGSSGGMIGAAYFRERYLEKINGQNLNPDDLKYVSDISNDLLNPVAFTIATNDLAFRFQKFKDGPYSYIKDRAFAFEEKLNANTGNVLNKRLKDYRLPEEQALIPMMLITPTIVNDGRKLIISSQGVSFMTDFDVDSTLHYDPMTQSVEFTRLFANQDAQNLRFTSALRMSATFPYITPITMLPSDPAIEAMDAGLVDNFGLEEAVKYIYSFRQWLTDNVGRIIIIQIRDQYKRPAITDNSPHDLVQSLTFPVNRFYSNLFPVENYKEDRMLEYMSRWYKGKLDVICFQIDNTGTDDISLSWHLTDKEKQQVENSIKQPDNVHSVEELKKLFR